MRRRLAHLRNVHLVIASAAGVTILVAAVLGWLGWRLVAQEHALEQQRQRDRFEEAADALLAGMLRALTEAETRLAQVGSTPPWHPPEAPSGGAAVLILPTSVETRPAGALAWVPVLPDAVQTDEAVFQEAEKLEFRDKDLARAESVLLTISKRTNGNLRAEALLRLARVQAKSERAADALNTYSRLRDEQGAGATEVPYGLLARFERCKLLARTGARDALADESGELVSGLDAGRWRVRKDAYLYYVSAIQALGVPSPVRASRSTSATLSEAVQSLWEEWEAGGRRQLRPGRRVFGSGDNRMLVLANSTPDRIALLVYPQPAIQQLKRAAGWDHTARTAIAAALLDEDGKMIFGSVPQGSSAIRANRNLSAAQIPWTIQLAGFGHDASGFLIARRDHIYVAGLCAIALVVALACYTMARGVLREIEATRLQSDFVSAVSHEFRSPLSTLCQLTELLDEGRIQDENRRRKYFNVLHRETIRLNRLVENLLDFGRIEAGRGQYRPEPIDVYELAREAVRDYEQEIGGSGYAFELGGDTGTMVRADREGLRRVTRNLLENAVKYSPDHRTVWIDAGQEHGMAVLRVRDRGMGIAPEEQSRVFDKFIRGQAAKEACIQGTGIGLAMVKEIVRAHDGQVDLVSEVGGGSTFIVRLPLARGDEGGT